MTRYLLLFCVSFLAQFSTADSKQIELVAKEFLAAINAKDYQLATGYIDATYKLDVWQQVQRLQSGYSTLTSSHYLRNDPHKSLIGDLSIDDLKELSQDELMVQLLKERLKPYPNVDMTPYTLTAVTQGEHYGFAYINFTWNGNKGDNFLVFTEGENTWQLINPFGIRDTIEAELLANQLF